MVADWGFKVGMVSSGFDMRSMYAGAYGGVQSFDSMRPIGIGYRGLGRLNMR